MMALLPLILEIVLKLAGFLFAKAEEKNAAEKDLMKVFRNLDKINERSSNLRDRYKNARNL